MPPIKIDELAPIPFFARFLEGQYTELTSEQMRNLHGGTSVVTQAAPSDSDLAEVKPSPYPWPEVSPLPLLDPSKFPWSGEVPGMSEVPAGPAGPCVPTEFVPR